MNRKHGVRRSSRRKSRAYMSLTYRKQRDVGKAALIICSILILACVTVIGTYFYQASAEESRTESDAVAETTVPETTVAEEEPESIYAHEEEEKKELEALKALVHSIEPGFEFAEFTLESTAVKTGDALLDEAYRLAAGYDYDAAIALVKSVNGYGNMEAYTNALGTFQAERMSVAPYKINNNITQIFFHSLICNPELTFNAEVSGYKLNDYNEAMTTVNEFVAIMEAMYERGYVLVDIYDVAKMEVQSDGTEKMTYQQIMLPEGKTPFILSIDDTNYYEYMTGHGFSTKLVLDENGKVRNEYVLTDGTIVQGSFDVITILEDFIALHPDFVYHDARGISAITGYNGVLGYRTSNFWYEEGCEYYEPSEANNKYFAEEISGYNANIEADKITATAVANAIKAMNWRFASHTWGHKRLGLVATSTIVWDSDLWEKEVASIIGDTDILIFPYGNDIGQSVSWREYEYEGPNERYQILKSYGFHYYLNVDSSVYFMQRTDEYFRSGRRNLDGDRLWEAYYADEGYEGWKNRVSDLFDVKEVIDEKRPEMQKYLDRIAARQEASAEQ